MIFRTGFMCKTDKERPPIQARPVSEVMKGQIGPGVMVLGLAGVASAISVAVPEVDPASATSGLALLAGAVILLLERRGLRRR